MRVHKAPSLSLEISSRDTKPGKSKCLEKHIIQVSIHHLSSHYWSVWQFTGIRKEEAVWAGIVHSHQMIFLAYLCNKKSINVLKSELHLSVSLKANHHVYCLANQNLLHVFLPPWYQTMHKHTLTYTTISTGTAGPSVRHNLLPPFTSGAGHNVVGPRESFWWPQK